MWLLFSQVFTIIGLGGLLLYALPVPFFDRGNATVMSASREKQIATARALENAIGIPMVELNTEDVRRFIYRDGTNVDALVRSPTFELMYHVTALKSVVLSIFSRRLPLDVATDIENSLKRDGHKAQVVLQPDTAFPNGATILVLSDAFQSETNSGFGLIVRKHAFRVGGQRPSRFRGW